jgi:hypothetical protein
MKSDELLREQRKSWSLKDWNCAFSDNAEPMTKQEISDAAAWLIKHNYPLPSDCPAKTGSPKSGGCPEFRPACLLTKMCRVARGMAQINGVAKCATCPRTFEISKEFRDDLSRKEFEISGMCQICQDTVSNAPVSEDPCDVCDHKSPENCKECPI